MPASAALPVMTVQKRSRCSRSISSLLAVCSRPVSIARRRLRRGWSSLRLRTQLSRNGIDLNSAGLNRSRGATVTVHRGKRAGDAVCRRCVRACTSYTPHWSTCRIRRPRHLSEMLRVHVRPSGVVIVVSPNILSPSLRSRRLVVAKSSDPANPVPLAGRNARLGGTRCPNRRARDSRFVPNRSEDDLPLHRFSFASPICSTVSADNDAATSAIRSTWCGPFAWLRRPAQRLPRRPRLASSSPPARSSRFATARRITACNVNAGLQGDRSAFAGTAAGAIRRDGAARQR